MLIDEKTVSRRTAAVELMLSATLVIGVGIGIYLVQHPHVTPAQLQATAIQQ